MKIIKVAVVTVALLGSALLAFDSEARGRYYGGGHRHHHYGSGVGFYFGFPALYYSYPGYYGYPRYYYPPAVSVAPSYYPPAYIEQPAAAPAPASSSGAYWYYCRDSQTYYPYVQQCASQWQQVVPNSGPPS